MISAKKKSDQTTQYRPEYVIQDKTEYPEPRSQNKFYKTENNTDNGFDNPEWQCNDTSQHTSVLYLDVSLVTPSHSGPGGFTLYSSQHRINLLLGVTPLGAMFR